MRPPRGSNPAMAEQVTLFPEPLSPTMARISPCSKSKSTPCTTSFSPNETAMRSTFSSGVSGMGRLEGAAGFLLAFNGFKQRLEVALPEGFGAFALDDFKEHGRAVDNGFGEDLQQVSLVIAVDEDAELA